MEVAYWGATNVLAAPFLASVSREVWGMHGVEDYYWALG